LRAQTTVRLEGNLGETAQAWWTNSTNYADVIIFTVIHLENIPFPFSFSFFNESAT